MKFIFFVVMLVSNTLLAQSKWRKVTTSDDGKYITFVRYEKTEKVDIHIWMKTMQPDKVIIDKDGKTINEKQNYMVQYVVFHCGSKTTDKLEFVYYDGEGVKIQEGNDRIISEKVFPETNGETVYNFVCGINEG